LETDRLHQHTTSYTTVLSQQRFSCTCCWTCCSIIWCFSSARTRRVRCHFFPDKEAVLNSVCSRCILGFDRTETPGNRLTNLLGHLLPYLLQVHVSATKLVLMQNTSMVSLDGVVCRQSRWRHSVPQTRWRICVTMTTLWQQQDGGYLLLCSTSSTVQS